MKRGTGDEAAGRRGLAIARLVPVGARHPAAPGRLNLQTQPSSREHLRSLLAAVGRVGLLGVAVITKLIGTLAAHEIDFRCMIRQMRIEPKRPRGGSVFPAAGKSRARKTAKADA
nr:hypothetical protein [Burkholderia sp. Ac-20349]